MTALKSSPQWPTSANQAIYPKDSANSPNSASSMTPTVETHEPNRVISYSNHNTIQTQCSAYNDSQINISLHYQDLCYSYNSRVFHNILELYRVLSLCTRAPNVAAMSNLRMWKDFCQVHMAKNRKLMFIKKLSCL